MSRFSKVNPYPNKNAILTLDYLEEVIKVIAREKGQVPITEEDGSYQDIALTRNEVTHLTPPEEAIAADICVEMLGSPVPGILVRMKENGGNPSLNSGFGFGHQDIVPLNGTTNLARFRAMALRENIVLRVQYFQTAQRIET